MSENQNIGKFTLKMCIKCRIDDRIKFDSPHRSLKPANRKDIVTKSYHLTLKSSELNFHLCL